MERKEKPGKKYYFAVGGFLFTALAGSGLHFLFEGTGRFLPFALFSPVNESVWEHLKLLFFPLLLYTLWEGRRRQWPRAFLPARTCALLAGLVSIPLLFYGCCLILGTHLLWADVAIFLFSILLCFALSCGLEAHARRVVSTLYLRPSLLARRISSLLAVLALTLLTFLFIWFTFSPPQSGLFEDPVKGGRGIWACTGYTDGKNKGPGPDRPDVRCGLLYKKSPVNTGLMD